MKYDPSLYGPATLLQYIQGGLSYAGYYIVRLLPYNLRCDIFAWGFKSWIIRAVGFHSKIIANLDLIMPELSSDEKEQIANTMLDNLGRCCAEAVYQERFINSLGPLALRGDGVDAVLQAHAENRPVIYLGGHFSNVEAFRYAMSQRGIKIAVMYKPIKNPFLQKLYAKPYETTDWTGENFEHGPAGTRGLLKTLSTGGHICLMIDLSVPTGERLMFMGHPAWTSTAAAQFALKKNVLYVPYFVFRKDDRRSFDIEIGAPIEHSDPITMTNKANTELEKRIRQYPGDWLWSYYRWKD